MDEVDGSIPFSCSMFPNPYGVLIGLPVGIIAMTERTPKVSKDGTEYILVDN